MAHNALLRVRLSNLLNEAVARQSLCPTNPLWWRLIGVFSMNNSQQQRFNCLNEQHLINLRLQGKREANFDGDTCSIRHISAYINKNPKNDDIDFA